MLKKNLIRIFVGRTLLKHLAKGNLTMKILQYYREPPFVRAIVQSFAIGIIANVVAQLIEEVRKGEVISLDWVNMARFLSIGIVMTPLNYWWQAWLEHTFPDSVEPAAVPVTNSSRDSNDPNITLRSLDELTAEGIEDLDERRNNAEVQPDDKLLGDGARQHRRRLNLRNTFAKWVVDCFLVGIWWSSVVFFVLLGFVKGQSAAAILQSVRTYTIPFVLDSFKLWPLAAVVALTLIPMEKRIVFYSAVGFCWAVYLAIGADRDVPPSRVATD